MHIECSSSDVIAVKQRCGSRLTADFRDSLWRDNDFFTTFDKYYFALKRLNTREFWQNTNVFEFRTAENC